LDDPELVLPEAWQVLQAAPYLKRLEDVETVDAILRLMLNEALLLGPPTLVLVWVLRRLARERAGETR